MKICSKPVNLSSWLDGRSAVHFQHASVCACPSLLVNLYALRQEEMHVNPFGLAFHSLTAIYEFTQRDSPRAITIQQISQHLGIARSEPNDVKVRLMALRLLLGVPAANASFATRHSFRCLPTQLTMLWKALGCVCVCCVSASALRMSACVHVLSPESLIHPGANKLTKQRELGRKRGGTPLNPGA